MPTAQSTSATADEVIAVVVTARDNETAGRLASTLVGEKLVACVNLLPGLRSIYRWQGKVCDEPEVMCLMKTRLALFPALRDRIVALHEYEVPEIIAFPIVDGSEAYLEWVRESTIEPG